MSWVLKTLAWVLKLWCAGEFTHESLEKWITWVFSLVFGGGGVSLNSLEANNPFILGLASRRMCSWKVKNNYCWFRELQFYCPPFQIEIDFFISWTRFFLTHRRWLRGLRPVADEWFYLASLIPVFSISHIRHGLISLIGGQLLITPTPVLLFWVLAGRWINGSLFERGMRGCVVVRGCCFVFFFQPGRGSLLSVL